MNATHTARCFAMAMVGLVSLRAANADDWQPEQGFISLYNGKDLTGWCYDENDKFDGKTEASDGRYTAKGETIVVNPHDMAKGPRLRQMWTTRKISRRLRAEARIPRRGERR